jgi:hypothetical protein
MPSLDIHELSKILVFKVRMEPSDNAAENQLDHQDFIPRTDRGKG